MLALVIAGFLFGLMLWSALPNHTDDDLPPTSEWGAMHALPSRPPTMNHGQGHSDSEADCRADGNIPMYVDSTEDAGRFYLYCFHQHGA